MLNNLQIFDIINITSIIKQTMHPSQQQHLKSSPSYESHGSSSGNIPQKAIYNSAINLGKRSSIDETQREEYFFEFDWATHFQIIFKTGILDTANSVITNNLSRISAALVYTNYEDYTINLLKKLNINQIPIAKRIKSCAQIQQTFQQKNNKIRVFVIFVNRDNIKTLSESHYVPNFVNFIVNFTTSDMKQIQQYEWRIRKKINYSQQIKQFGVVANLFYSQGDGVKFNSVLIKNNLKSQSLKFQQMKQLSQYFKTEYRGRKMESGSTKSLIVSQANQSENDGKQKVQSTQNAHEEHRAYGWATFLQAKSSQLNRPYECGKYINVNKNNFHACIVYTFNEAKGNQIINYLDSNLRNLTSIIKITSQKPFKKDYFQKLQKGQLKIIIVCIERQSKLNDWKLPYNVDFIINEELSQNDESNENRLQRQHNPSVEYNGVVLCFAYSTDEIQVLNRFTSKIKAKVEIATTNSRSLQGRFKQKKLMEIKRQESQIGKNSQKIKQESKAQIQNKAMRSIHSSADQKQQKQKQSNKQEIDKNMKKLEQLKQQNLQPDKFTISDKNDQTQKDRAINTKIIENQTYINEHNKRIKLSQEKVDGIVTRITVQSGAEHNNAQKSQKEVEEPVSDKLKKLVQSQHVQGNQHMQGNQCRQGNQPADSLKPTNQDTKHSQQQQQPQNKNQDKDEEEHSQQQKNALIKNQSNKNLSQNCQSQRQQTDSQKNKNKQQKDNQNVDKSTIKKEEQSKQNKPVVNQQKHKKQGQQAQGQDQSNIHGESNIPVKDDQITKVNQSNRAQGEQQTQGDKLESEKKSNIQGKIQNNQQKQGQNIKQGQNELGNPESNSLDKIAQDQKKQVKKTQSLEVQAPNSKLGDRLPQNKRKIDQIVTNQEAHPPQTATTNTQNCQITSHPDQTITSQPSRESQILPSCQPPQHMQPQTNQSSKQQESIHIQYSNTFQQIIKQQEKGLAQVLEQVITNANIKVVSQVKVEIEKYFDGNKKNIQDSNYAILDRVEKAINPQLQTINQIKAVNLNIKEEITKNNTNLKTLIENDTSILNIIDVKISGKMQENTQKLAQKLQQIKSISSGKLDGLLDLQTSTANSSKTQSENIKKQIKQIQKITSSKYHQLSQAIQTKNLNVIKEHQNAVNSLKQQISTNINSAQKQTKDLFKASSQSVESIKNQIKNNHALVYSCVNETIPSKIEQCIGVVSNKSSQTQKALKQMLQNQSKNLQNSAKTQKQQMSKNSNQISKCIIENTNKLITEISSKQSQIRQKRDQQQKKQQEILRTLNEKLMNKQQSAAEKQMEQTISRMLNQNKNNAQKIKQLEKAKTQTIRINKQSLIFKDQLRGQKRETQRLRAQIKVLNQQKNSQKLEFDEVKNNYAILSTKYEEIRKRCIQQQQVKNQLGIQLAELRKDVSLAKEQIMTIAGVRDQKKLQKPSSSIQFVAKSSKNIANQNALLKIMENQMSKIKDIQNLSITEAIKKYISVEKKGSDKLKPLLQKAIDKTVQRQDTQSISQLQQFRQIKTNLTEVCRLLQSNNLLVYFNKIIIKLMEQCDSTKVYQNDLVRYCKQLENSFSSLAEKITITFTKGDKCSIGGIMDHNKKESIVNNSMKSICKTVNEYTDFCNKLIAQLKKANKQIIDFKNAADIQAGIISSLHASKKETETKLTACQSQLTTTNTQFAKQKQILDSVRKQLAKKTQQYSLNQQNYLKIINDLNQQVESNKKTIKRLQTGLYQQKKQAKKAADQASKQLERVKKNATQTINKLRGDISKLEKKLVDDIKATEDKYESKLKQQKQKSAKQLQQAIKKTTENLTNKHNIQMIQSKLKHDTVQDKLKKLTLKTQKLMSSFNSTLLKITNQKFSITLDNFEKSMVQLQNSLNQKYGKILFMPESPMYKAMKPEDKKFVYDNIVSATNKKISHTETLFTFHNEPGDTWEKWRSCILDRPNLLVIMTLENKWQIGAFSENPYSQTDRWQTGKGYLMSITNKRRYDVKRSHEGKVARFAPYAIIFGNNELLIQQNLRFSILMNKMNLHFATQGDRSIDFIGMEETDEGQFTQIQFYQVIFE